MDLRDTIYDAVHPILEAELDEIGESMEVDGPTAAEDAKM